MQGKVCCDFIVAVVDSTAVDITSSDCFFFMYNDLFERVGGII
jgi:hypothetical protein